MFPHMGNFHISYFGRVSLSTFVEKSFAPPPQYRRQKSRLMLPLYIYTQTCQCDIFLLNWHLVISSTLYVWQLVSPSRFHAVLYIHLFLYCIQSNVQMSVAHTIHAYMPIKKKKRNFKLCVVWLCLRVSV